MQAATEQMKKPSKKKLATRVQYGALTYRKTKASGIEILLMTSRETKRWIVPKGWPIKGMKPCDSAAQEAYEEAGVRGTVGRRPIGKYTYDKRLDQLSKVVPCEVMVYALRVRRQDGTWPEEGQRELRWCQPDEAIAIADDNGLGILIRKFAAQHAK
jgi:8-oxo-dGTP pyrophosphatase MutT (NUDIX family)